MLSDTERTDVDDIDGCEEFISPIRVDRKKGYRGMSVRKREIYVSQKGRSARDQSS